MLKLNKENTKPKKKKEDDEDEDDDEFDMKSMIQILTMFAVIFLMILFGFAGIALIGKMI